MKIGILTFHEANNNGAILQAYALQEVLSELSHDVEIIDYKQPYITEKYKLIRINKNSKKAFIRSIGSTILNFPNFYKKKKVFNQFRKEYINISKKSYFNGSEIDGYDAYVVGSDQIWNSDITGFDKTFYCHFSNFNAKNISYAASLGRENLNDNDISFIKENIKNFDSISVREDSAKKLISTLTNKSVELVLDPTLLIDSEKWLKFTNNSTRDKYLLMYCVGKEGNTQEIAKKIARKLSLKIISVNDKFKINTHNIKNLDGIGPESFVDLFKNAEFVVTNSFHGTAFSIIFNRDFVVVPQKTGSTRMISLLNILNLTSRVIFNLDQIDDNYNLEIQFSVPNDILVVERNKSREFLVNSLKQV